MQLQGDQNLRPSNHTKPLKNVNTPDTDLLDPQKRDRRSSAHADIVMHTIRPECGFGSKHSHGWRTKHSIVNTAVPHATRYPAPQTKANNQNHRGSHPDTPVGIGDTGRETSDCSMPAEADKECSWAQGEGHGEEGKGSIRVCASWSRERTSSQLTIESVKTQRE